MFSFFQKVKKALAKTRSLLGEKLFALLGKKIDEETLEELERIFYEADFGTSFAEQLVQRVKEAYRKDPHVNLLGLIEDEVAHELLQIERPLNFAPSGPTVILIVGVNGSGKTTSVAKLAKRLQNERKRVLVAAADTFRAAAADQLELWAEKLGLEIVSSKIGSDSAAVVFDALAAAKARGIDVVIIDTAGRLQVKTELMKELEKIKRVCAKSIENAPHETLLVVDATLGQNIIDQARIFHQFTPLTGLILTKLDGTAKGGAALAVAKESRVPIKFIGTGEGSDDLQPFEAKEFAKALFA